MDEFRQFIYNDEYRLIDSDYEGKRPKSNLTWYELFNMTRSIRILDYGGGNGETVELAKAAGFSNAVAYDPFVPEISQLPQGTFDLVFCFELIEHSTRPMDIIAELSSFAGDNGVILFSTLLVPDDFRTIGLNWWYVAPRNGHVSFLSSQSLNIAFGKFGYRTAFFDHNKFIAFREVPAFAQHLFTNIQGRL